MNNLNKQEINKYIMKSDYSSYFIRNVFCYLRMHLELLENEDYKHLYKEIIDFLLAEAKWEDCKENREWIEYLCDLRNKNTNKNYEGFTKIQVIEFLEYRKKQWE